MTWTSRFRNNLSKLISNSPQYSATGKYQKVDLNAIKSSMSMPLEEMMGGLSQPVWGPEISTIGAYSREGYTSKPFDIPAIPFRNQAIALQQDEDVQLAINRLSAQVTGGEHYINTKNDNVTKYLEKFAKDINFDTFDTQLVRELLWYGNSVWKPKMGIKHVRKFSDLMHIPISSYVRVWWDRQRQPYKYEFRGAQYQGYHNPEEIIVFDWNNVDASVFGTGFGVALTSPRDFEMILTGDETVSSRLPSALERKYAVQFIMQMATQRYVARNVWVAKDGSEETRQNLESQVNSLNIGQDVVAGSEVVVQELGTNTRSFNPAEFTETVQGPIMKGLNDFSGKQGSENSHTFANADTAKDETEVGLSAFNIHIKNQLKEKLFKPWYENNVLWDYSYMQGLMPIPWYEFDFDFNFGAVEKKDIPIEDIIKLIDSYQQNTILMQNVKPLIDMYKMAGVPIDEDTINNINMQYNDPQDTMALNGIGNIPPQNDMGGGEVYPQFNNQNVGSPPMDNYPYDSMSQDMRGNQNPFVPTNYSKDPKQNQDYNTGRDYE